MKFKQGVQKLGRSMLVPVAAMPLSGLVQRIAADDMLGIPVLGAAGNAVFGNLDMLFAIGVSLGFAKSKNKGMVALTAVLGLLVFKQGLFIMDETISMGVFAGIIAGLLAAWTFDKHEDTDLPQMFAFWSKEKFPMTMIMIYATFVAIPFGYVWPMIENLLDKFATQLVDLGAFGVFLFMFFNRLLIPLGLHHVLNSYIYYELGSFTTASGTVVTGEMPRFLAQDPTAGFFLSGFFIVMMFGIPGICAAIYKASKHNREMVKGVMTSAATTSFVTGITEPAEFSFMFVAPQLYVIHAFYAGLAGAVAYMLNVRIGFSFGSCIVDFILNYNIADNAWIIIPLGLGFFFLYYFTFYFVIVKQNLKTLGREDEVEFDEETSDKEKELQLNTSNYEYLSRKLLGCLGGADNVDEAFNCVTRLRVVVKDPELVDTAKIKQLGVAGVLKVTDNEFHIIIGPEVTSVMAEFKKLI